MDPKDRKNTRHWAIAPLASAGFIAGYTAFELVNRETGRAHTLHIPNGGLTFGFNVSGGPPSYTLFETRKPVNFADFNGVGARITSANIGIFYGYSLVYLTLWKGSAYVSDLLAYVKMSGGSIMLPGGSVVHGVTKVTYGSGTPTGKVPMKITFPDPKDRIRIFVPYRIIPRRSPRIVIPENVLFDFDKHNINKRAEKTLLHLADLLNNRARLPVLIEGHTDAIGSDRYNQDLSLKRARAVKTWLVKHSVYRANEFVVKGRGEKKPIAPNRKPDGSDNPGGRRKNRRVEIEIKGPIPPGFAR